MTTGSLRRMSRWLHADAPELVEHDDLERVWAVIEPINDPALAGLQLFAQAIWLDPCGSEWFASSAGLSVTVRP